MLRTKVPVGTIAKAFDDTLGEAEFIYLPGVANLVEVTSYDLAGAASAASFVGANANCGQPCSRSRGNSGQLVGTRSAAWQS
jgi:hypothetical protein